MTASDTRRVDFVFGIGCDDTIEEAQQMLIEVVTVQPGVLPVSAPVIKVNKFADSSVTRQDFQMSHPHYGKSCTRSERRKSSDPIEKLSAAGAESER